MGDELVPPGMTFHLPNSDVLEQNIYRIVTRKGEHSQLELRMLVLSSGCLLKCCAWSLGLKQISSLLHFRIKYYVQCQLRGDIVTHVQLV